MRLATIFILLCCAPIIPGFAQSQVIPTLSPEDRELVATALSDAEWAMANGVMIESTAAMCKSVVAFCISADWLDRDAIWSVSDGAEIKQAVAHYCCSSARPDDGRSLGI